MVLRGAASPLRLSPFSRLRRFWHAEAATAAAETLWRSLPRGGQPAPLVWGHLPPCSPAVPGASPAGTSATARAGAGAAPAPLGQLQSPRHRTAREQVRVWSWQQNAQRQPSNAVPGRARSGMGTVLLQPLQLGLQTPLLAGAWFCAGCKSTANNY